MNRILILISYVLAFGLGWGVPLLKAQEMQPDTRIITDDKSGTITFLIDDKAMVQINRDGLYVVDNVSFGGVLRDKGHTHIQDTIKNGGEHHAE